MGANDLDIQYEPSGSALILEITVEKVIADWWVRHVIGQSTIQSWQGRTDDPNADVAAVNIATVKPGSSLVWLSLLYGPNADMTVQVTIDVRQGGVVLGSKLVSVPLTAEKATQVSGTIQLSSKARA